MTMNERTRMIWFIGSDIYKTLIDVIDEITEKKYNLFYVEIAATKLYVDTMITLYPRVKS